MLAEISHTKSRDGLISRLSYRLNKHAKVLAMFDPYSDTIDLHVSEASDSGACWTIRHNSKMARISGTVASVGMSPSIDLADRIEEISYDIQRRTARLLNTLVATADQREGHSIVPS